ncbi:hypothetical protein [Bradyrhizobium algeriense]|uniref:hypothetical protein n=1 Tax=Bradyrhizobium algeriense TaxID=634784 RepID=UPI001FCF195C|nr:hypothetical protein [Bradyrhizobium algeriense]
MVRDDDLDLDRWHRFLKILGRHPGGSDRPWSAQIGQWAGLVIDDADPDDATGEFGSAGGREGSDWCPKDQKSSNPEYRSSRVRAAVPNHAGIFPGVAPRFRPSNQRVKQPSSHVI